MTSPGWTYRYAKITRTLHGIKTVYHVRLHIDTCFLAFLQSNPTSGANEYVTMPFAEPLTETVQDAIIDLLLDMPIPYTATYNTKDLS